MDHIWDVLNNALSSGLPFLVKSMKIMNILHGCVDNKQISKCISTLIDIDKIFSTTMSSHVTRRSSFVQGSGMLRAFTVAFPNLSHILKPLKRHLMRESAVNGIECGHAITMFGAICGILNISNVCEVVDMFIYTTSRDMVSAAVRLNLVGPLEGGHYTNELCTRGSILSNFIHEKLDDEITIISNAHQVAPLVEIVSINI